MNTPALCPETPCYRAEIKVDILTPTVFLYSTVNNMAISRELPSLQSITAFESEFPSEDVIIVGDPVHSKFLLAGAVTANRSFTFFTAVREARRLVKIRVLQPSIKPEEPPEEILILTGSDWRELLVQYAEAVADKAGVKPMKPAENLTGYCTWYYYYTAVSAQDFQENLNALQLHRESYPARVVQIDDGYQTFMGNWFDRNERWPEPLETVARRIRAYIPACGSTDEWMDLCDGGAGKYKSERYRAWCREKGLPVPDDVPARSRRGRFGFENVLRDPATDAESIRYWRFTSSLVCDTIREFADRVRKRCGREIEPGVFYGYILELGGDWVKKGHLAYQELLASGSIDFLISPGTYEHRKIGDGGGFMVPMGTVRRFGRNYLHECDQRTHCFNPNLSRAVRLEFQHWQDEAEDIAGMRREMALSLIHHTSLWWFDMWGGYYQSPAVFDNLARMKELWDRYSGDDSPGRAEIALVVDPDGAALVNDEAAGADRFHRDLCHLLNRVGAPFEAVSFDDLLEPGAAEKYKFLVFASIFELSEERLRRYREWIAGGGRTILWLYAAGISDGIQIQLERNRELAGVPFGTPGLSLTEYDSHRTLYLCRPEELTVPLLRQAVRDAGVHIWTEEEAPVFANARLAAFHTARGGERSLMFPAEVTAVTELFSGRRFELRNHCLAYPFDTPDTVLFELHADSSGPR